MKTFLSAATLLLVAHGAQAALVNGGFEQLLPTRLDPDTLTITDASNVPGWKTTATDNQIEIWATAVNGVSAYEGTQFAELNANLPSALSQEVSGIAKDSIVGWQFAHRGRFGSDTMLFVVADLGANGVLGGGDDTQLFSLSVTDDSNAWGFYSGSGIVALGNTMRVAFVSGATAGGNEAVGNFLDAADFGVGVGRVPEPTSLARRAGARCRSARQPPQELTAAPGAAGTQVLRRAPT